MMMKKKKMTALVAGTALCLMLSACGAEQSAEVSSEQSSVESTAEQSMPEAEQSSETTQEAGQEQSSEAGQEQSVEAGETAEAGQPGTYPDGTSPEYSGVKCRLTVDGEEIIIAMYDNTAVDAFLERLPLEGLEFFDLSGIEKPIASPDDPFSIEEEEPGYDPVTGEMVIYRPWGNFTIFYGDFRHSDELVPLGKVESGLEILAGQTDDFTGVLEVVE